jgi:hypothetical protein
VCLSEWISLLFNGLTIDNLISAKLAFVPRTFGAYFVGQCLPHPHGRAHFRAPLSAVPIADLFVKETRERIILKCEVPTSLNPPVGCSVRPRYFTAIPECARAVQPLREISPDHQVACIRFQF